MKKTLKILFFTLFAFILLSISKTVEANSINSISMDIFIDDDGNAQVEEIWNCSTSSGTEVYHPYYNLGNSVISDLTVSDGSTVYETLSSWNTSGTLSSKANKCGINRISNGVELCWGISSYGSHTYSVKYNISNFVSELEDSQMIYWTLIPYDFSNSIGKVSINIRANFSIPDSVGVWGYGNYGGTAYVYEGIEGNIKLMTEAASRVKTGQITFAARDSEFGGFRIKEGEILALLDGKLVFTESDPVKAAARLTKSMISSDSEFITVIYGENISDEKAEEAKNLIESSIKKPLEINLVKGGQPIYHFIISVE